MSNYIEQKRKAFTLSFDDGVLQDKKLIKILDKYNAKCTFNINYGRLGLISKTTNIDLPIVDYSVVKKDELKQVYKNHEVGGHGLNHPHLIDLSLDEIKYEINEDKKCLEELIGNKINIFAYPYGEYNGEIINVLKDAGYIGARTVNSTYSFDVPKDFLELNPTCHYNDSRLIDLAKEFVEKDNNEYSLFYVWGHSYELDQYNNYEVIENLLSFLSKYKDDIWFATNSEIIDEISKKQNPNNQRNNI